MPDMSSGSGVKRWCKAGTWRLPLAAFFAAALLAGQPAHAQDAPPPAASEDQRGMELQRYRDAVRRHFVLKQYRELLELTEKYGHLYPEDEGTEFYRTQAEIKLEEAERKIPFTRLEDRDFKIPESPEGGPSLLDQLRQAEAQAAAGAATDPGIDSAAGGQVAMGTGPLDEELPVTAGDAGPFGPGETAASPEEAEPAPRERTLPADLAETEAPAESAPEGGGVSPLLLILGGCAVILALVAVALMVGLVRRGRSKAADIEPQAAPAPEAPAPPLFNFEDSVDQPAPLGDTFGEADFAGGSPEPFAETAMPEAASSEFASVSAVEDISAPDLGPVTALGETRAGDVNQEISDLLYSPGSGADSAPDRASGHAIDIPAPLGETRTGESIFGVEGHDTSDLVQLPDEDVFELSSSSEGDVDALFAEASQAQAPPAAPPPTRPRPMPAADSSADLSSIDLFADQSKEASLGAGTHSTTRVGLDEVDEGLRPGSDASPSAPPAGSARNDAGMDIPFALEDPFQNLSGKKAEQTSFNTSTAEGMALTEAEAQTGAEERELLQIMEEGEGPAATSAGDDLWSSATLGGAAASARPVTTEDASDALVAFQEDQTAVVEFDDATGELPTGQSDPGLSSPEADTVARGGAPGSDAEGLPDDPFDRERLRGQEALQQEDWSKAVYHLSIAATLRPEAQDVRDDLRRARKMKKEQQTG